MQSTWRRRAARAELNQASTAGAIDPTIGEITDA